jgi:hypothetical protein
MAILLFYVEAAIASAKIFPIRFGGEGEQELGDRYILTVREFVR